ncbi:MAG: glutamine-hydrolyzing carbamoyl-phosphate synthase small subunit [Firmicutes bacterium]|nr:glutamine-hydrolyzing carbamoyl-phosphate synthase small subunit [Bacillota bacterium]
MDFDRKVVLKDGREFYGRGFGAHVSGVFELVFNTSMVGYQEIISDPSNYNQMVLMTYPLIGNYGITDEDFESKVPRIGALVVREYNDSPSNFRYTKTLGEELEENDIPGICELDTRKLAKIIRDEGTQPAMLTDAATPVEEAIKAIEAFEYDKAQVAAVSCKKRWYSRTANARYNIVAVDCGIKLSFIRTLNSMGCNVTVVPYDIAAEELLALKPDGVFLSNGPGDPRDVTSVIELVKAIRGKVPVFGIGLGHQLIALAYGATTSKLPFGHRGGNHPVKELATGRLGIIAQNQGFTVDADSLEGTGLTVTFTNVLDGTCEGVECAEDKVFSVQFHPDGTPGPQESTYLFDKLLSNIQ